MCAPIRTKNKAPLKLSPDQIRRLPLISSPFPLTSTFILKMGETIKQHGPWLNKPLALGHLVPTAKVLFDLQEKFLSVFCVASILESRSLPWYIIHHDIADPDSCEQRGPIPGNDYHASDPRITTDPSAWDSKLRLEPWNEESGSQNLQPLIIPFKHISQYSPSDSDGASKIEEAARLIRIFWPDDSIGPPRRRFVGRRLTDASAPEYHIFHWLASKKLNGEGVSVTPLFPSSNGHFVCSHRDSVRFHFYKSLQWYQDTGNCC